jgi:hypothetical protein
VFNCSGGQIALNACPKRWDALEPADNPRRRYCSTCDHLVHLVANAHEAAHRMRQNECIAIPPSIADQANAREGRIIAGQIDWLKIFTPVED